jgi:hypothetical protein
MHMFHRLSRVLFMKQKNFVAGCSISGNGKMGPMILLSHCPILVNRDKWDTVSFYWISFIGDGSLVSGCGHRSGTDRLSGRSSEVVPVSQTEFVPLFPILFVGQQ